MSVSESSNQSVLEQDLAIAIRLRDLSTQLISGRGEQEIYERMLETAMTVMEADFASMQMLTEVEGSKRLRLLAWKNFHPESARFWEMVTAGSTSACGAALERGERFVITDCEACDLVAGTPDLEEYRRSGIRAVQSTPLISRSGRLLGMISTHWRAPHKPSERGLRVLDVLARQVADMMERKQQEERLAKQARLLDLSYDAVLVRDAEDRIVYWNRGANELYGFSAEEALGRISHELLRTKFPEPLPAIREKLLRGGRWEGELNHARQDGQRIAVLSRWALDPGEEGKPVGVLETNNDITEWKEADNALREAHAQLSDRTVHLEKLVKERTARLQELVGELEHFSYTITHDLRSPLRAIKAFAEMMGPMACGECDCAKVGDYLARISESAERMDRLIADALDYSRSARQEVPVDDVDAGASLQGILDSYPELHSGRARIVVDGPLPVVLANQAGLTQAFSNLLGNAVKFVTPGEKAEVRVWAEGVCEGWVRIWVEDKGIGISKEALPRVFDMFWRASSKYEGTGIGLALVRKVVERMGGRVGAQSVEGKGSRFWIELRCGEATPRGADAKAVLYVEDDESDRRLMERAFEKMGFGGTLQLVKDGRAALEYLSGAGEYADRKRFPIPAVVLLDLKLPHVPGFDVLAWIRSNPDYEHMPVVVFSSSALADDQKKAEELGASDFVAKSGSEMSFGEMLQGLKERWLGMVQARQMA